MSYPPIYCKSSLPGLLKVNDPKDIHKDTCLHTYVIDLPGVKAEDIKIRVSDDRFLIIEVHSSKETVSHSEDEVESIRKKPRKEMDDENGRKFLEAMEEINWKLGKEIEEIDRRTLERDKRNEEMMKHLKEIGEKQRKKKFQEVMEDIMRMYHGESYPQPTLPLGPFADMVGYPFSHPTSYHMPLAFQAYCGNNTHHQSWPAVLGAGMKCTLAQFKTDAPSNSFSPATAVYSGNGGFAGSGGKFSLNPFSTPASSTAGYGSRTVSAIPSSAYYSFQGQGQGQVQEQQKQQQQQHYGDLGSQEQQSQNDLWFLG